MIWDQFCFAHSKFILCMGTVSCAVCLADVQQDPRQLPHTTFQGTQWFLTHGTGQRRNLKCCLSDCGYWSYQFLALFLYHRIRDVDNRFISAVTHPEAETTRLWSLLACRYIESCQVSTANSRVWPQVAYCSTAVWLSVFWPLICGSSYESHWAVSMRHGVLQQ